ncbi:hypothetical protein N9K45_00215 [bacterium]|nr:hypothetical protein [bacterium]
MADACSRSVLFALQANWWFQSNMADQIFRQRCSELWLLCENACTAEPPSCLASRSCRELAEERTRDALSAAHSFARACLADGVEQRHAPREALLASVSAALSAVDTWHGDDGRDQARPVWIENCQAVAESAKQMLEFDGEAVMSAYHAFLNVAADLEVGETDNCDSNVGGDQSPRPAADPLAGEGLSGSSRGGGCHPDLYRRQLEFVSTLSSLSGSLRNVPVPQRQQKLQEALEVINQELSVAARSAVAWLEGASAEVEKLSSETASDTASADTTEVHDTCSDSTRSELPLPQPVIFPLDRAATGSSLRRVLRIVPDSGRVLKSRERTPLLLHVELFTQNEAAQVRQPNLDDSAVPQAAEVIEENSSPAATDVRASAESVPTDDRSVVGSATGAAQPQAHRCYGVQFVSAESDSVQLTDSQTHLGLGPEPEPEPEPHHESRATAFESVLDIENRLRTSSPFGHLPTWGIGSLIVKSGDDIRQEQLAMQLISEFEQIFSAANLSLWLRPYRVLATDPNSGLIELVPSVMSIHALKDR